MGTSKTEEEIRKHFALFHSGSMVSRSLRFILASFCFLGHVIGQGMTKETHAHDRYHNSRFNLFTRCQPMHLHVAATDIDIVDDAPKVVLNEKRQKELRGLVERRLRTARLYQETSQNYLSVSVLQQPAGNYGLHYSLIFSFEKLLYDQATDSWGHASTYDVELSTEHAIANLLSSLLDHFLEAYVEENKKFCH